MNKLRTSLRKLTSIIIGTSLLLSMFVGVASATSQYTVTLSVNQPTYTTGGVEMTGISPGNIVYFSYVASPGNAGWKWNWPANIVDCAAFPEFDSPQLKCSIKANGTAPVSITMFPLMSDGSTPAITSNLIYLNATGVTSSATAPQTLPNLTITGINFNAIAGLDAHGSNFLTVTQKNNSATNVNSSTLGHTYIWIDDMTTPVWTYRWDTLESARRAFLNSYGSSSIQPQVLYGTHKVKACIDALNIVAESNEADNCLTTTMINGNAPTNNNTGTTTCTSPYVLYQGTCTDPIPACQNPPAHFMPSSCIDKIENGQYIERYNFQCESGYVRSGSECVRTSATETNTNNTSTSVGFYDSEGNDSPYYVGDTVRFKVQMLESPSNIPASPDRGWSLSLKNRYHFYDKKQDISVPIKNVYTEFGNEGYWYIYFDAPTPNDYDIASVFVLDVLPVCGSSQCSNVANRGSVGIHYNVYDNANTNVNSNQTGLKYSVSLLSDRRDEYKINDGSATEIMAKVGDGITFTRVIDNKNAVNEAWDWNWESMLDCAPSPDFDSPVLKCIVKKNGISKVSVTMYPVTADGKQYTVNSNTIYVTTGVKNPSSRYTGSSSARTDGNVSVPPAGFEKEVTVGTQTQNNPFSDTNMATLAGKAAAALYRYAIIGGFPDGQFKGSRSVNRAEAAKFLLLGRYESVPDNKNEGYFHDVLNGEWYTKYVITAAGLGVISGYNDGTFKPANQVNTAEFLKMLTLTFELETGLSHSFTDIDRGAWYAQYVGVASKYKLFPDRGSKLQPSKSLTRDEVAVAIYQYLSNKD